jgi:hypothetical protein
MDNLPPPPVRHPVLKRIGATTGYKTHTEILKRKILDLYENLAGRGFNYDKPGIRGLAQDTVFMDRDDYESGDYKESGEDSDSDSDSDSYFDMNEREILESSITTSSIGKFLRMNGDDGVAELNKIKGTIIFLNKTGARNEFNNEINNEPVMQHVIDELVAAIPKIDSAIRSFKYKIPDIMRSGKDKFYKKYLKYKQKYLELKKKMKK